MDDKHWNVEIYSCEVMSGLPVGDLNHCYGHKIIYGTQCKPYLHYLALYTYTLVTHYGGGNPLLSSINLLATLTLSYMYLESL